MPRLTAEELKSFMAGKTLYAFDPDTKARVASVSYGSEGDCVARFADGTQDTAEWGLEGDTYWTRYANFRGGEVNRFTLDLIADQVAQAYHTDGRRAFLQSPLEVLDTSA